MSFDLYLEGLKYFSNPMMFLTCFLGVLVGIVFGALPGLTATMTIAVFIPFTFSMDPVISFAFLLGLYTGAVYGGSISAILINIPGTPSAIATGLDGYPMCQKGQAGEAIGISTVSSAFGGFFSVIILSISAPLIAGFALKFSAEEYVGITLIGLSVIAIISPGSTVKGLIGGVLGLILGTFGLDPITSFPRFIFGRPELLDGIDSIPVMIGVYGLAEMFGEVSSNQSNKEVITQKLKKVLPSFKDVKRLIPSLIRSSFIGTIIGAIPAAGGSIASLVAYGQEKKFSKNRDLMGTGIIDGVAAPEAANNASTGGALIPMMTLGIPGDPMTAVLMGGLIIQGLRPGPILFQTQMPFVSSIFISLLLSVFFMLFIGLAGARVFSRLITVKKNYLIPAILIFCLVGAYAINNSLFDVGVLIVAGLGGFAMKRAKFSVAPIILGMILGPLFESNLRRSLILSQGNWSTFVTRPISLFFLIIVVLIFSGPSILYLLKKIKVKTSTKIDS
ncbi:MAG: tripartite tricarboxylate transporter permease [Spirochaetaceae bacterium]|jgi:putative tricarboxylic transport membrane protein|nr:tripartite tricarboxylate transporter permease [Spirochaetaceae bacterium]